jgi:hypothetical protein
MSNLIPHLEFRGMVASQQEMEDEIMWPVCRKPNIDNYKIKIINLFGSYLDFANNECNLINDAKERKIFCLASH